jgi:hypothetical protein
MRNELVGGNQVELLYFSIVFLIVFDPYFSFIRYSCWDYQLNVNIYVVAITLLFSFIYCFFLNIEYILYLQELPQAIIQTIAVVPNTQTRHTKRHLAHL